VKVGDAGGKRVQPQDERSILYAPAPRHDDRA
jgi:hypothetical protein